LSFWIIVLLGFILIGEALMPAGREIPSPWPYVFAASIYYTLRFVPCALVTLWLCRSAYRSGRGQWSLSACLPVALLSGSIVAVLTPHSLGFDFWPGVFSNIVPQLPFRRMPPVGPQVVQMAVPLALWLCFAVRFGYQRRVNQSAPA